MSTCYGVTRNNKRCRFRASILRDSFMVPFPVCKHHANQNVILQWSKFLHKTDRIMDIPQVIYDYILFMDNCLYNGVSKSLSLVLCKEFFMTMPLNIPIEECINMLIDQITSKKSGVHFCPICMSNTENAINFKCQHSLCFDCTKSWIKNSMNMDCPVCREFIL